MGKNRIERNEWKCVHDVPRAEAHLLAPRVSRDDRNVKDERKRRCVERNPGILKEGACTDEPEEEKEALRCTADARRKARDGGANDGEHGRTLPRVAAVVKEVDDHDDGRSDDENGVSDDRDDGGGEEEAEVHDDITFLLLRVFHHHECVIFFRFVDGRRTRRRVSRFRFPAIDDGLAKLNAGVLSLLGTVAAADRVFDGCFHSPGIVWYGVSGFGVFEVIAGDHYLVIRTTLKRACRSRVLSLAHLGEADAVSGVHSPIFRRCRRDCAAERHDRKCEDGANDDVRGLRVHRGELKISGCDLWHRFGRGRLLPITVRRSTSAAPGRWVRRRWLRLVWRNRVRSWNRVRTADNGADRSGSSSRVRPAAE